MEYAYKLDSFFQQLYERDCRQGDPLLTCPQEDFPKIQREKRALLQRLLGIDKLNEMASQIESSSPVFLGEEKKDGCVIRQIGMTILPGLTMPAYILKPNRPRLDQTGHPIGIIYCHGHGKGGVRDCFDRKDPPAYHKYIPLTLAERGYTVFTFEPAAFGDFRITDYQGKDTGCYPVTTRLLLHGITAVGLRVYQAMSVARYMAEQGIQHYGIAGISGGGTVTSLYAALDDQPSAVVISGYANLFSNSIMAVNHCVDNFVPNILQVGEMPYIISLAVPKPLYVASGTRDPIFPLEGTKKAVSILSDIYQRQGIKEKFSYELFDGVHEFSEKFIDWLDQTL